VIRGSIVTVPNSHWDERYGSSVPDFAPTPLVVEAVRGQTYGRALDLACGTGGNALWLAEQGWHVSAVDVSSVAIELLNQQASRRRLAIKTLSLKTFVADLETGQFPLETTAWDLIVISKYFHRDLFPPAKQASVPGGMIVTSALLQKTGETSSPFRVQRGELRGYFADWEILLDREPQVTGAHSLAELIARKPKQ
jgi:SAM-dependent methyltransferase